MSDLIREELDVLQTDLDDESPQVLGALVEKLLGAGALDAHLAPLFMKKNRPGTRVEVLCRPEDRERLVLMLLRETATLGVKVRRTERYSLPRSFTTIRLYGAEVRVKQALWQGRVLRAVPEFEDCRRLAEEKGLVLRDVLEQARTAAAELVDCEECGE